MRRDGGLLPGAVKSFPQQRAGDRREHAGALLAQDQQNKASPKAAEELQAQLAASDEGSQYVSSLSCSSVRS